MVSNSQKNCTAEGCGHKPARGKRLCIQHLNELKEKQKMTPAMQMLIRSNCCSAGCVIGVKHEYGEQYCKKCKEGCVWKLAANTARNVATVG